MSTSSVSTTDVPVRFTESFGDYLAVDELAEYLLLFIGTINHWRREGSGLGVDATTPGRFRRYSRATVEGRRRSRTDRR